MKPNSNDKTCSGITILEVWIVVAVFAVLLAVALPSVLSPPHRHPIFCANNLKQIGLGFKCWSLDNNDRLPMQVSTNEGGTMEWAKGPYAYLHFSVMSNELSTPKLLVCPKEKARTYATNFSTGFNNSGLSYFVALDATNSASSTAFLSGDRNITNCFLAVRGQLWLTTNQPAGWTHELHVKQGNILFEDGSVQEVSSAGLRTALARTGTPKTRLAMP